MKKLKFTAEINAPRERVWNILWADDTYRQWTSVFMEGSYAETIPAREWKKGNKIKFLSPDGSGLFGTIEQCTPPELMSFRYEGVLKNNVEQPLDAETKQWAGAAETYILTETNGKTTLNVELDATDEFSDYFSDKFPRALEKVKELSGKVKV